MININTWQPMDANAQAADQQAWGEHLGDFDAHPHRMMDVFTAGISLYIDYLRGNLYTAPMESRIT